MNRNTFIDAIETKDAMTENGMITHSTSSDSCVDFFFTAGAMRIEQEERITDKFLRAYSENSDIAMKLLFWVRDIRGGAGERRIFRILTKWLAKNQLSSLMKNIEYIAEFGRWDDLLYIYENTNNKKLKSKILKTIGKALNDKNGLCAKWMPRKGFLAKQLRTAFDKTPKQWRKMLVELTEVVETPMCNKQYDIINYSHVPSVAMSRYKNAFYKNDSERFSQYIEDLKNNKKNVKINASSVFPHDIVRAVLSGGKVDASNEQWKALPNWLEGKDVRMMPIVDVSGSMTWTSISGKIKPIDVAISLGIYLAERNEGPFKDRFITFSTNPKFQHLQGNLSQRISQMVHAEWDNSTNIEAVFEKILDVAKSNKVKKNDMPTHIIILSDMEFDQCVKGKSNTVFDMIRKKYKVAGYKCPNVIFWNIQSRHDNIPVKFNQKRTALVSGFSPSICKSILSGELSTPFQLMMNTIGSDRYNIIEA